MNTINGSLIREGLVTWTFSKFEKTFYLSLILVLIFLIPQDWKVPLKPDLQSVISLSVKVEICVGWFHRQDLTSHELEGNKHDFNSNIIASQTDKLRDP